MAINPIIKLEKINLRFKDKLVFNDFSLAVYPGEVICLKAPSGFGKSTLINLLLGFIQPDSGSIFIKNQILNGQSVSELRSTFSWLPQNYNLFNGSTVGEAIRTPFESKKNKHEGLLNDFTLSEALSKIGLTMEILEKSFDKISGGEKQRIGLLICKIMGREVMLLDEPTSALDADNKELIADFLTSDFQTIVSASHDDAWLKHCSRIIELDNMKENYG